jgi:hypothetical protein
MPALPGSLLWVSLAFVHSSGCSIRLQLQATPFQALLLVRAFRPDCLPAAMNNFVCSTLNVRGIVPLPVSFQVWSSCSSWEPVEALC